MNEANGRKDRDRQKGRVPTANRLMSIEVVSHRSVSSRRESGRMG